MSLTFENLQSPVPAIREILSQMSATDVAALESQKTEIRQKESDYRTNGLSHRALPGQSEVQRAIQHSQIFSMMKKLTAMNLKKMESVKTAIDQYESLLNVNKIAMELSYQKNGINALPVQYLEVLTLSDTVPMLQVHHRLNMLSSMVSKLMDINGLMSEPVTDSGLCATLDEIYRYCNLDRSLGLINDTLKKEIDPYLDLALMRDVKYQANAKDLGYSNVACGDILNQLNTLVGNVSKLYYHWFIDTPLYGDQTSRIKKAITSIPENDYSQDVLPHTESALYRSDRLDTVFNLLLEVVYPALAIEMDAFVQVCDTLGQYKHLNTDATPVVRTGHYPLEATTQADHEFLSFLQDSHPDTKTSYIVPALDNVISRIESITLDTPDQFDGDSLMLPITPVKYFAYLSGWSDILKCFTEHFNMIGNPQQPVNSWMSLGYQPDTYFTLKDKVESLLKKNDVSVSLNIGKDLVYPVQYGSPYRTSKYINTHVSASELGYGEEEQKHYSAAKETLKDDLSALRASIQLSIDLFSTLKNDPKESNGPTLGCLYELIAHVSQTLNYLEYDAKQYLSCYR